MQAAVATRPPVCELCTTNNQTSFCYDCNKAMCAICMQAHRQIPGCSAHNVVDLAHAGQSREDVRSLLTQLQKKRKNLTAEWIQIQNCVMKIKEVRKNELEEAKISTIKEVANHFKTLELEIDEHCSRLESNYKETVDSQFKNIMRLESSTNLLLSQPLSSLLKEIDNIIAEFKSTVQSVDTALPSTVKGCSFENTDSYLSAWCPEKSLSLKALEDPYSYVNQFKSLEHALNLDIDENSYLSSMDQAGKLYILTFKGNNLNELLKISENGKLLTRKKVSPSVQENMQPSYFTIFKTHLLVFFKLDSYSLRIHFLFTGKSAALSCESSPSYLLPSHSLCILENCDQKTRKTITFCKIESSRSGICLTPQEQTVTLEFLCEEIYHSAKTLGVSLDQSLFIIYMVFKNLSADRVFLVAYDMRRKSNERLPQLLPQEIANQCLDRRMEHWCCIKCHYIFKLPNIQCNICEETVTTVNPNKPTTVCSECGGETAIVKRCPQCYTKCAPQSVKQKVSQAISKEIPPFTDYMYDRVERHSPQKIAKVHVINDKCLVLSVRGIPGVFLLDFDQQQWAFQLAINGENELIYVADTFLGKSGKILVLTHEDKRGFLYKFSLP